MSSADRDREPGTLPGVSRASLINNNYWQAARPPDDNDNNFPNRTVTPRRSHTSLSPNQPPPPSDVHGRTGNSGHDVFKNGAPLLLLPQKSFSLPPTIGPATRSFLYGRRRTRRNRSIFRASNHGYLPAVYAEGSIDRCRVYTWKYPESPPV